MYFNKEICTEILNKKASIKIGRDAIKVNHNQESLRNNRKTMLVGTIKDIGLNYVDVMTIDHQTVTLPIDKIASVICTKCNQTSCYKRLRKCMCENKPIVNQKHVKDTKLCDQHDLRKDETCKTNRKICFIDYVIPFCDKRIELRLAGLTDEIYFSLLQHKGCKVKLFLSSI